MPRWDRQGRVAPQSGQVFCDNDSYTPCFDLDQHTLKAGAVIVRARIAIINKEHRVREVVLFSVVQKDILLVLDRKAFAESLVLLRQSAVKWADSYINRLVSNGHKVAICEQMEDPKQAKGIVKREVIPIIEKQ